MWRVTYDCLEDKSIDVQSVDFVEGIELKYHFRMLDDDGEIYYRGASDSNDDEAAFAPLDDYGMPNAGCTEIQYINPKTGIWEPL